MRFRALSRPQCHVSRILIFLCPHPLPPSATEITEALGIEIGIRGKLLLIYIYVYLEGTHPYVGSHCSFALWCIVWDGVAGVLAGPPFPC